MADMSAAVMDSTSSIDYGIVSTPPRSAVNLAFGRRRTLVGLTNTECLFLGVSILNIVIALALTIYRLVVASQQQNYFDIIFTLLIIFNAVCCLFYSIHGLLRERAYELYALIAAMIIILLYCIVQFSVTSNKSNVSPVKLARLVAACILVPLDTILTILVVQNFGWLEFKIVGASEALQQMYRQTAKFSTLLKFDLQVTISFVILFMKLKLDPSMIITNAELIIIFLAIPFSMAWDMLGYVMMRKEVPIGAIAFLFLGMVKPAFYLYKIINLYLVLPSVNSSQYMIYTMLTAAAVAMIVWLFLMIELYFVYQNFGKGLKERVFLIETKSAWHRLSSDNTQTT